MVSIYKGEGSVNRYVRHTAIEAAIHTTTHGIIERTVKFDHAAPVVAIAKLLRKIEEYDTKHGFDDQNKNNSVYYAQQMAQGFERELKNFLRDTKGLKNEGHGYIERLETFKQSCNQIIVDNID